MWLVIEHFKNEISILTIFMHIFGLYTILGSNNPIFNVHKCQFHMLTCTICISNMV